MSKKTKIMALVLCLTVIIAAMPIMAFADDPQPSITITGIDIDVNDNDIDVTVSYNVSAEVGDQITILSTTTTDVITSDNADEVISYIDQFDNPGEGDNEFSFSVSTERLGTATVLYVKMGGTDVLTPGADEEVFAEETIIIYGDVDGDGEVTAYDASLVLQYVVGKYNLDDERAFAAAAVNDGVEVTAYDASLILQYVVNKISLFPIEQD